MDARGQITLYHPEDRARVDADIDRMLQGESLNGEYRIITKSGEQRWVHIYRRPVWDENQQRVSRYYGVAQDITERKQSEAQRFKLTLERERLALVNRLVQAVSHDFRTSMANIETSRYLIQRLLPGELREELLPKLNTIQERVMHLNRQLDNLRMVSSLANPQTEPCNLNGIVESVLTGYRLNDQFRKLQIKTELDPQLPAIIGDKGELKHVLQQLVANALNHTPEGGTITLRTFGNAADVILRVEDTGSGIAPQHLPHIFELFYRADPARSVESGGVGLGLSIVKMIVEAHGGTVSVESTVGKGTTFSIALHSQATPQPST
jgi:signal transduction histidine kinase